MQTVNVVDVKLNQDMRKIHSVRERLSRGLSRGHVVLCLNKAGTIARVIDAAGGVHQWYSDDGYEFDVKEIQRMVGQMNLRLMIDSDQEASIDTRSTKRNKRRGVRLAA